MMSYKGYRIKINENIVPNVLIASGTYSFTKVPRVANAWTDARGRKHKSFHDATKAKVSFSIRERNLEEQDSIKHIFQEQKNVSVEYWDDYECKYKTGTFEMSKVSFGHKKALDNEILYKATAINLEEY